MNIDDKRFPESTQLIHALDMVKKAFGCSDVKIGCSGEIHTLSQIKKNLLELSSQSKLDPEIISAIEDKSADILTKVRTPGVKLHITPW